MTIPPTLPSIPLHTLITHARSPINALAFSARGGTYILTGSSDRQIHLCRSIPPSSLSSSTSPTITKSKSKKNPPPSEAPTTTTPIQTYTAHGYPISDLTCSHDNTAFASCGGDRTVFVWDVSTALTTRRFGSNTDQGHTSRINCVRFAGEDGSVLISGSDDRSVRVWDLKSRDGRPVMVWGEAADGVSSIHVRGAEVWSGSTDGRVRRYDIRMGRVTVDVFPAPVACVRVTRDGEGVLVGCLDSRVRLMDGRDGTCLRAFGAEGYKNEELRLRCAFGRNESIVISGSEGDGAVRGWDVVTGKMVGRVELGAEGKVVSCVEWRDEEVGAGAKEEGVWAAGSAGGRVIVFGNGVGLGNESE